MMQLKQISTFVKVIAGTWGYDTSPRYSAERLMFLRRLAHWREVDAN